jgi:hypothetical protein
VEYPQGLDDKGTKKSPEPCGLGLNPLFQKVEETMGALANVEMLLTRAHSVALFCCVAALMNEK